MLQPKTMGPLNGIRVIEVAGIGPGPFCGMMLADMGADVVRIDRPGDDPAMAGMHRVLLRNRRRLAVDLKNPDGVSTVLRMVGAADVLFEGFRPGVAERLGVGPDACHAKNPRLVYGRMTGWGQTGPLAQTAGHDINYIALSGALHAIGRKGDRPVPPLNLVGDFGGGGMMLAFGIVCALLETRKSGMGQVVDASMVEGSAALMSMFFGARASGLHGPTRGANLLDTGAPFYDVYETKDAQYLAVGPLEPQFFAVLQSKLGLDASFGGQFDVASWPTQKETLARVFLTRTRDEWEALFAGTDACVSPVLSMDEAPSHPHNASRRSFVDVGGAPQPAPTPRFSRTSSPAPEAMKPNGTDTRAVLLDFGFAEQDIDALLANRAVSLT
jgi:alpha-methylacyl-CoA racemase